MVKVNTLNTILTKAENNGKGDFSVSIGGSLEEIVIFSSSDSSQSFYLHKGLGKQLSISDLKLILDLAISEGKENYSVHVFAELRAISSVFFSDESRALHILLESKQ